MIGTIRMGLALLIVAIVTTPLAPVQLFAIATRLISEWWVPRIWHGLVIRILGIRVHIKGEPSKKRPLLFAANHISWTDIMVLSSIADVHFIAKSEVAGWPVMGMLAKLQRSVFVERDRKRMSAEQAHEIATRLDRGDPMVLFAEGATADGNFLDPFKSTLFGAAQLLISDGGRETAYIQPVAIVYTRLHGMPMGRQHRTHAAWIGDRLLAPHIAELLREGGMDVEVHFGEPLEYRAGSNRKDAARAVEATVRAMFVTALRAPQHTK